MVKNYSFPSCKNVTAMVAQNVVKVGCLPQFTATRCFQVGNVTS